VDVDATVLGQAVKGGVGVVAGEGAATGAAVFGGGAEGVGVVVVGVTTVIGFGAMSGAGVGT